MTADAKEPFGPAGTLLLVTADLFLGSRLRALAEQAGFRVVTVAGPARLEEAMTAGEPKRWAIDLTMPGIDLPRLGEQLSESERSNALAYAPHVRVDLLKAARAAGIGTVLTRSQLDAAFSAWLSGRA